MSALPKCSLLDGVDQIYSGRLKAHFERQSSRPRAGSCSWGCFAQPGTIITLLLARALALPFTGVDTRGHVQNRPNNFHKCIADHEKHHLQCWTLLLKPKYWSCCCNTEDVKRQGCCTRWTSHLSQDIHLYTRKHNSKLLESIKMIPALLWLWLFGLRALRTPCPAAQSPWHTRQWWLWSLCPRRISAEMKSRKKSGCCARPWALLLHSHI